MNSKQQTFRHNSIKRTRLNMLPWLSFFFLNSVRIITPGPQNCILHKILKFMLKFLDLETTKNTFFSKCYGINSCRYITFLIVLTRVSKKRLIYLQSVG